MSLARSYQAICSALHASIGQNIKILGPLQQVTVIQLMCLEGVFYKANILHTTMVRIKLLSFEIFISY